MGAPPHTQVLDKLEDDAVEKPKLREPTLTFKFPECSRLAPPVLPFDDVCFSYSGKPEEYLYRGLSLGVDCDSRVALVGPNGCGKSSTLTLTRTLTLVGPNGCGKLTRLKLLSPKRLIKAWRLIGTSM